MDMIVGLSELLIPCQSLCSLLSILLLRGHIPGPGQFTITDASIGADRDLINVTYMEVSRVTIIYIATGHA